MMMLIKLLEVLGLWWLVGLLLPFVGGCSLSAESAEFAKQATQNVTQAAITLEEAGIDHRLKVYLPVEFQATWSPFGVTFGMPGGYSELLISRGRGLGTDVPTGGG
jgi:hypothetical protein